MTGEQGVEAWELLNPLHTSSRLVTALWGVGLARQLVRVNGGRDCGWILDVLI